MNYLLDTCLLSEFRKKPPEPKVMSWVAAQDEESLFLSVVTIGEIQKGISRLAASKRKTGLSSWLDDIIFRYGPRVLPVDLEVMRAWGRLAAAQEAKGRKLPPADSLIAATAIVHDLVVVTRNEADFRAAGVAIKNVWL